MKTHLTTSNSIPSSPGEPNHNYFRFHLPHLHLASVYGDDWFALRAEAFARFFGTPIFLVANDYRCNLDRRERFWLHQVRRIPLHPT